MSALRDIDLLAEGIERAQQVEFNQQVRHIAALIERHLPKIKTPNFWKILVLCCEAVPERDKNFAVIGGVMDVYLACDIESYFKLSPKGKKEFAFKVISQGLEMVAAHTGLGEVDFNLALEASKLLINEWAWPKSPISSPDRKWKAQLWCSHEIDCFKAHLIVMDKQKQESARAFVFEAPPSEFQFVPLMFAPEWISSDEIEVGEHRWKWDADKLRLSKM